MASSQAECDDVQDEVHFASPTSIMKIILEGSDQGQEIIAPKHLIEEHLKLLEGHLGPKHIDDIKKPIDNTISQHG